MVWAPTPCEIEDGQTLAKWSSQPHMKHPEFASSALRTITLTLSLATIMSLGLESGSRLVDLGTDAIDDDLLCGFGWVKTSRICNILFLRKLNPGEMLGSPSR